MSVTSKAAAIATLTRRADYLRSCVSTGEANGYDFAEIAAIEMASQALAETDKKLLNVKRRRMRRALQRRLDHLESITHEGAGRGFFIQEITALRFAVETINEHFLHHEVMAGPREVMVGL